MSKTILQLVEREASTIEAYIAMVEQEPETLFFVVPDNAPALLRDVGAYLESQKKGSSE